MMPQASRNAVPSEAFVFKNLYNEIEKLRACRMSRRDIVSHMDTKQLRKNQANAISFWEGVLALLNNAANIRTFSSLSFFREFYEFG